MRSSFPRITAAILVASLVPAGVRAASPSLATIPPSTSPFLERGGRSSVTILAIAPDSTVG